MRINQIDKARKSPGRCTRCGRVIAAGESYKWLQAYRGPKRCYCTTCRLRPSDTTSGRLSEVYAAQENAQDDLAGESKSVEDLKSILETLNEEIERLRDEYQEAADAISEHFEGSEQHSELEEKASALDDWAGQISDEISALDDFDEDTAEDEDEDKRDVRFAAWLDERHVAVAQILNDCPI